MNGIERKQLLIYQDMASLLMKLKVYLKTLSMLTFLTQIIPIWSIDML